MQGKKAYLQAGGGIVADSDPAAEFQESMNKAKAVLRAVELARSKEYQPYRRHPAGPERVPRSGQSTNPFELLKMVLIQGDRNPRPNGKASRL